jgi:flagellar export protein FliJ
MERFKFKFASVLKVRKSREDEALRSLSIAQKAHQNEIRKKEQLMNVLQQALARREQIGRAPELASSLYVENDFIKGTKHRMMQADQAIMRTKRGVEKALRFYLSAKRHTRAIEILKEDYYAEYKKMVSKEEQKKLDDLVIMRSHANALKEENE